MRLNCRATKATRKMILTLVRKFVPRYKCARYAKSGEIALNEFVEL